MLFLSPYPPPISVTMVVLARGWAGPAPSPGRPDRGPHLHCVAAGPPSSHASPCSSGSTGSPHKCRTRGKAPLAGCAPPCPRRPVVGLLTVTRRAFVLYSAFSFLLGDFSLSCTTRQRGSKATTSRGEQVTWLPVGGKLPSGCAHRIVLGLESCKASDSNIVTRKKEEQKKKKKGTTARWKERGRGGPHNQTPKAKSR